MQIEWDVKWECGAPNSRVSLWSGWLEPEVAKALIKWLQEKEDRDDRDKIR